MYASEYLRKLALALMQIPVVQGVDQSDCDQVLIIADIMEKNDHDFPLKD